MGIPSPRSLKLVQVESKHKLQLQKFIVLTNMPWTATNPSPMCPACSRSVFPAEAYMARERKEGARQNGGCPACSMLTGPDDFAEVSGLRYHKACLCCTACSRPAEVDTPMLLGPRENENVFGDEQLDPYCNICFAKKFKMSVLNIADTVNIIKGL